MEALRCGNLTKNKIVIQYLTMETIDVILSDLHVGKYGFQANPNRADQAMRNTLDFIEQTAQKKAVRLLIGGDLLNTVSEPNANFDVALAMKQLGPLGDLLSDDRLAIMTDLIAGNCDRPIVRERPGMMKELLDYRGSDARFRVLSDVISLRDRFLFVHGDLFEPSITSILKGAFGVHSSAITMRLKEMFDRAYHKDPSFDHDLDALVRSHESAYNLYVVEQRVSGIIPPVRRAFDRCLHRGVNFVFSAAAVKCAQTIPNLPKIWINGHTHAAVQMDAAYLQHLHGASDALQWYVDTGTLTADKRDVGTFASIDAEGQPHLHVSWQPNIKDRVSEVNHLSPKMLNLLHPRD